MALLFISNIVPDCKEYQNPAFARSGNNVLLGIADHLSTQKDVTILSCMPIPAFPKGPLFYRPKTYKLASGSNIEFLPILNIKLLKQIVWGILCFIYIIKWSRKRTKSKRTILLYNTYTPPISWIYRAARVSRSKLYAILYDLGMPSKKLGLSLLTRFGYRVQEKKAKKYISKIDGRIVINENIIDYYAPNKDYILVDGGINNEVINELFPLKESTNERTIFVCAGLLWEQNGIRLLLSLLKNNPNLNIEINFAGSGPDEKLVQKAAAADPRIRYHGMLSRTELFKLYSTADCLLNLRKEDEIDFHFPSKLIEYLATGKHIISTKVAHAENKYGAYMTFINNFTESDLLKAINTFNQMPKDQVYKTGCLAREYMLKSHTWDSQTEKILNYIGVL